MYKVFHIGNSTVLLYVSLPVDWPGHCCEGVCLSAESSTDRLPLHCLGFAAGRFLICSAIFASLSNHCQLQSKAVELVSVCGMSDSQKKQVSDVADRQGGDPATLEERKITDQCQLDSSE